MSTLTREAAEDAIGRALVELWDGAEASAALGVQAPYTPYAHEVCGLLLRGGSNVQVERYLRRVEDEELHRPASVASDLEAVVRALRAVERAM